MIRKRNTASQTTALLQQRFPIDDRYGTERKETGGSPEEIESIAVKGMYLSYLPSALAYLILGFPCQTQTSSSHIGRQNQ